MTRRKAHKSRKQTKRNRIILTVVIAVAAGLFCFSAYKLVSAIISYSTAKNAYRDIQDIFTETSSAEEVSAVEETATGKEPVWQYDFNKLLEINPDAIGYIKMRGEEKDLVDYPIVQGVDDSYYLNHMFDGRYNPSGAIFMESYSRDRFDSRYAIIYGHNMRAGSRMFGCLDNYKNEDFFKEHQLMDVYAGDTHYVYRVFSAFTAPTGTYVFQNDGSNYSDFIWMMGQALGSSPYDTGVTIDDFNEDSHVLVLSTCLENYAADKRFVVFLLRET
ncbi:MAG: class B sortase [Lachnospiraceae bacterium]|jgi:sortase B